MWWISGIRGWRTWLCGFEWRWDEDVICWNEKLNPRWIKVREEHSPVDIWCTADVYLWVKYLLLPTFAWVGAATSVMELLGAVLLPAPSMGGGKPLWTVILPAPTHSPPLKMRSAKLLCDWENTAPSLSFGRQGAGIQVYSTQFHFQVISCSLWLTAVVTVSFHLWWLISHIYQALVKRRRPGGFTMNGHTAVVWKHALPLLLCTTFSMWIPVWT